MTQNERARFFCLCACLGVLATTRASVAQTYNQHSREATLKRSVSYMEPPTFWPTDDGTSVVLEVKEAVNSLGGVRLRHRSYNGHLVGPVLRVRPGSLLHVRLENHLPPEPSGVSHDPNAPHGFNTTNLHTHGLHVSPKSPGDNVFTEVAPGCNYDFAFAIPEDHPAGTFWYHAHKHGSTALQLASGMAGALIVEGGLDDAPGIREADEKVLVLQQFAFRNVPGDYSFVHPDDVYKGEAAAIVAVNGQVTPTIVMRPGEVQRWRFVHGGISDPITLKLNGIPLHEIAVDGLATGTRVPRNEIELHPGYRCDVLIKAPLTEETRVLTTEVRDPKRSFRGRLVEMTDVLKLVVTGKPNDMPLPPPESLRPYAPLTDADVPQTVARQREWRMALGESTFHINETAFNPNETEAPPIVLGTAEEWILKGESGGHPFHVHVNPFAVPLPAGDPSGNRWVWRDTLFVEHDQTVKVRSNFKTFDGRTVLHCHILDHEDQGMMKAIEIVPPPPPPAGAAAALETPVSRPLAPEWQLKGLAGQTVGLRTFLDDPVILVFHRGFACEHCAEQITALARHHDAISAEGIELIAISPELPVPSELSRICQSSGIRFPLLADPKLTAFRSFGCVDRDGDPLHGVFLIDRAGRIAWSRTGQQPERAVDEILAKARRTITASTH